LKYHKRLRRERRKKRRRKPKLTTREREREREMAGEKIVGVAVDFSSCSRKALKWAADNIIRDGDHLVLVIVQPEGYYEDGEMQLWEVTGSRMYLLCLFFCFFFFFNMLLSVCFPGKSFIFERNALSCVIRTIRLRMEYSIGCFVLSIFLSFDVHLFLFLLYLLFSWNF
jgi:hypothetical protein